MAAPDPSKGPLSLCTKVLVDAHGQSQEVADQYSQRLASMWVNTDAHVMTNLQLDRSEKQAGRSRGCDAWRAIISALGSAGVPEHAWPMVEASLIKALDGPTVHSESPDNHTVKTFRKKPLPVTVQLQNAISLPWPIHKEAELLGARQKNNRWPLFANEEHANIFRFHMQWGESAKAPRCDELAKRWKISQSPGLGVKAAHVEAKKVKLLLQGPARKTSEWKPPSLDVESDKTKAEDVRDACLALYRKREAAEREIDSELEKAQAPVPVRVFHLVRKPAVQADPHKANLPYSTKPEDYLLVYKSINTPNAAPAKKSAKKTLMGSPAKKSKIMMADVRYQKLLQCAKLEWVLLSTTLDPAFEALEQFLMPEVVEVTPTSGLATSSDSDTLGSVENFEYAAPQPEAAEDESDQQTRTVLMSMFELASDPEDSEDFGLDVATLLAKVLP